ncbi:MAG: DUF2200 family protein [Balneolaceae bacterium]|nr:DUF2200 family protein [Balneolaceae bacterium]MBO6545580.1 DUF2200 family protein [Balneolaceae bacterium]MBO6646976.1 DUF2200 family protein [Balneolaceae bacterium]
MKKGRTKEELFQVIEWLTRFHKQKVNELIEEKSNLARDGLIEILLIPRGTKHWVEGLS